MLKHATRPLEFSEAPQVSPAWLKALGWMVAIAALMGAWWLYTRPDFLVNLADQLWSCF